MQRCALVPVHTHLPVAMVRIGLRRCFRLVYGYLVMIHPKAVTLGIAIREQSSLQHFVGRKPDAGNDVYRIEGGLFHVLEIVVGVPVQLELSYRNQRELSFIPYFG